MGMASQVQMMNGLGLCLCATRKSRLIVVPLACLTSSTVLFSGLIYYSKIKKDFRYNKFIPIGGAASILGWAFMIFC